jgi:UDP-N-acetylglucosamine 2-epimerase (non-hydrolysing)
MKLLHIVGARPNFVKLEPILRALAPYKDVVSKVVHTGQHYDDKVNHLIFWQLDIPEPDHHLDIRGGTHTEQVARVMLALEPVLEQERPDRVVVYGDVNATIAGALAAAQMGIPVAHVEAGLRCGDMQMPEEVNRIVTDRLSDLLFVSEQSGLENLAKEGIPQEKVHFMGNVMIDTLMHYRRKATYSFTLYENDLMPGDYVLMTMHRPSNVDTREGLDRITRIIELVSAEKKVFFPLHPRTFRRAVDLGLSDRWRSIPNVFFRASQGYLEFLDLMQHAFLVITDSGGIQEETTFLKVPCLTLRSSTERPVTVSLGTNQLISDLDPETLMHHFRELLSGRAKQGAIPPLWDGHAAERIAAVLSSR